MTLTTVEREVLSFLQKLPITQQYAVLAVVRALATPQGVPGTVLLPFTQRITTEDTMQMAKAIEHDCEQVNLDEW
nr:hypothetical protein [Oscillochloris trichoides]